MLTGDPQTPHFYDFWIFEPVTKPQNQLYLSLETPGDLKKNKKIQNLFKNYDVIKSRSFETPTFGHFRKGGHR